VPAATVPAVPAKGQPIPAAAETDGGLLDALRQARAKQRGREPPKE
jgi:hypothetical protein